MNIKTSAYVFPKQSFLYQQLPFANKLFQLVNIFQVINFKTILEGPPSLLD